MFYFLCTLWKTILKHCGTLTSCNRNWLACLGEYSPCCVVIDFAMSQLGGANSLVTIRWTAATCQGTLAHVARDSSRAVQQRAGA